ncbi:MAG: restriction endonuclease subunit S, partial [Microcystis aeruginosa]
KNLNTKIVEKLDIIIPNNGVILKLFDNFVNPAFTMILTLAIQNMKLRKARDIILPKLMNGEIEV